MDNTRNKLFGDIYNYYQSHFDELSFGKKLHFATRLGHWDEDPFCVKKLTYLQSEFAGGMDARENMHRLYNKFLNQDQAGSKNANDLRLPIFQKYPHLRTMNIILFRSLVYMQTYGIDCREIVAELYPHDEIGTYLDKLFQDKESVAILSTHAINTQYLYRRLIQQTEERELFDPQTIYELGKTWYDFSDKAHLKLYIYLYTHCIIGESIFYTRQVPDTYLLIYIKMLQDLESVITAHYNDINLDNKCEYLACCQIMGVSSSLRSRIDDECQNSVSNTGTFIVDTLNSNPQSESVDLDKSEHRNVLYIMSNRPYRPQDQPR